MTNLLRLIRTALPTIPSWTIETRRSIQFGSGFIAGAFGVRAVLGAAPPPEVETAEALDARFGAENDDGAEDDEAAAAAALEDPLFFFILDEKKSVEGEGVGGWAVTLLRNKSARCGNFTENVE